MDRRHWLMKSEPHVYAWEQLLADGSTHWDGVRNYQARNLMRDDMKIGDLVKESIGKLGENIRIRRFSRFELGG